MKIERMLAGQGDGTALRKHSFEEVSFAQGSEHRGKMWSLMTRGVSGGSQIRARRSREGTRMSEVTHLKLEFANGGLVGREKRETGFGDASQTRDGSSRKVRRLAVFSRVSH